MASTQIISLHLFNGKFLFILKFLLEVALVFLIGGILGTLLGLGKVTIGKQLDNEKKNRKS